MALVGQNWWQFSGVGDLSGDRWQKWYVIKVPYLSPKYFVANSNLAVRNHLIFHVFLILVDTAVSRSRTLFFGIQETMFQTRCYAKKRKKWEFKRKEYRITNLHLQPETNLQKHKNQHLHRNAICINLTCTSVYFGEGPSLTNLVEFVNKTLGLKLGPNYWVFDRKTLIQVDQTNVTKKW